MAPTRPHSARRRTALGPLGIINNNGFNQCEAPRRCDLPRRMGRGVWRRHDMVGYAIGNAGWKEHGCICHETCARVGASWFLDGISLKALVGGVQNRGGGPASPVFAGIGFEAPCALSLSGGASSACSYRRSLRDGFVRPPWRGRSIASDAIGSFASRCRRFSRPGRE